MKMTAYIQVEWSKYEKQFKYSVAIDKDREFLGEFFVQEVEIEFTEMDKNALIQKAVSLMKDEKQKILAETSAKAMDVQSAINDLLSIEDKS